MLPSEQVALERYHRALGKHNACYPRPSYPIFVLGRGAEGLAWGWSRTLLPDTAGLLGALGVSEALGCSPAEPSPLGRSSLAAPSPSY